MIGLWWGALALLILPIWWHRQRRQRRTVDTLATARFLPRTDPQQHRIWRWLDLALLLLRCLLLASVVAWLADLVLPWRGDSVLVAPGSDSAWVEQHVREAGFTQAERIAVPDADALGWLARHEREWRPEARLLVVGMLAMPASPPQFAHQVVIRSRPRAAPLSERHVILFSKRPEKWQALFSALDGPNRYVVSTTAHRAAELVIWDLPEAPPADLRAPLWWIGDSTAFPELQKAALVDGVRYTDSPRGRLWTSAAWPASDPDTARAQFETWQRLHYPPVAYPYASGVIAPVARAPVTYASGALHYLLTMALLALFALERILTHARRR